MSVVFRDEFERKAHDVICIVKHGSPGGNARTEEVRRVADYLRGGPLVTEVRVKPPVPVVFPKPLVVPPPPASLKLPQP